MRTPLLLMATVLLTAVACANSQESTEAPHEHADAQGDEAPAAEGQGHGHGQGGQEASVNEHGYKGHHRFDDPEKWTAHFESEERTAWQKPDEVVASLGLAADARVADLGAGTGYFSVRFAAAAPQGQVFAVDIEPAMVEWLGKRAERDGLSNLVAIQGEANAPALPEAVDVAFMCNVFHHLGDPKAYFEAVAGKLAPEGKVVIVDFRADNPEDAPGPPAKMRMTAEQITEIMTDAGYTLVSEDDELLEYQYMLTFTRG
ncbi:methyltransferase domain-containing protein [Pseudenhygromyxa sp. WMMC2535]|uniref:class I SAM-dependent methyltransferase n=1 Tax=Pseudenhygromyxa sp. WMMC2535 TaxID=2712867 RepID=UPI0015523CC2|nr:class I SAM-dependent methyltransferase [Pseudenhygromyxa sp. WMMC2535]NVB39452.1 methyltransferase domain-containing protein [Pseudenhygromyxa sp. WMMC2535]